MAQLGIEDIKKLADLAKIELTDNEEQEYLKNINDILGHVSQVEAFKSEALSTYDFDSQVRGDILPERQDGLSFGFDREIMLGNISNKSSDNSVKVSKVIKK